MGSSLAAESAGEDRLSMSKARLRDVGPDMVVEVEGLPLEDCQSMTGPSLAVAVDRRFRDARPPKPPLWLAILTVAFAVRSKASRQASAGGHLSIMSVKTDLAASIVKSTSSIV